MKLYSYHRSSAAYRVRIALNLKGLATEYAPVNLLQAEQKAAAYTQLNPQGLVPALETDGGELLSQSVAIMEYLDEAYPQAPLLPADPLSRARVRSLVNHISCDIHPLLNIAILAHLRDPLQASEEQVQHWYETWIRRGFTALEHTLAGAAGSFCCGETPTLADCCLVPQVFNARRFNVPLEAYPTLQRIDAHCQTLPAFAAAHPDAQPDSAN